jgi:cell wall-associated NlpC family hydrolase
MIKPEHMVNEARTWIGVPFRHQGRSRLGVDCIGLIICVRNAVGMWMDGMHETTSYPKRAIDELLLDKLNEYCTPLRRAEPGCVVLFKWPKMQFPTHVAICTGENIIHSYRTVGQVCEVGYREPWRRMTRGFYRLPGVVVDE